VDVAAIDQQIQQNMQAHQAQHPRNQINEFKI
jgi:hypothetical protein